VSRLTRGFLAIVPPPEVLDAIETLLPREQSSTFAWTRRDQWHVTLQFYGRVADAETLAEGIAAAAAASYPVQLAIRGGGAFPNPKRAHVFWLGVDGRDALIDLHAMVASATRDFIDRRDRITLQPHLTLARLKKTVDLTADVEALENVPVGTPWTLREVRLLDSDTRPSGAVYTEYESFPLGD
jgi:RNA 2',3'-cyclic 3'-phosphodiesterase